MDNPFNYTNYSATEDTEVTEGKIFMAENKKTATVRLSQATVK